MTPSRFRQLEAFRAAQTLPLSQPAVTKLVRRLEEETGLALFDRSRRPLLPPPEAGRLQVAASGDSRARRGW